MASSASDNRLGSLEAAARQGDRRARQELAIHLLSVSEALSEPFMRGVELLTELAEQDDDPAAQWYLASTYLQTATLPDASENAARWLRRAADKGLVIAADRLADIHLQGLGVARDPARALAIHDWLADQGVGRSAWQAGYLLTQGDDDAVEADANMAAVSFARGCALGHAMCLYSLGLRFLEGAGVNSDPAFARALLVRAGQAGVPDARELADAGAPRDKFGREARGWYDRLVAFEEQARGLMARTAGAPRVSTEDGPGPEVLELERRFLGLGHPALLETEAGRLGLRPGGDGHLVARPGDWDWLSERPRVAVSHDFATREECAHLIAKVAPEMRKPDEYRLGGEAYADLDLFDGTGSSLGPIHSDTVVRFLERRIVRMTGHSMDALEPCSIIRYLPREEYRRHVDYFTDEQMSTNVSKYADHGGQRLATFLLYLHPPEAGGETIYPAGDVTVRGETGMGLLHYNVRPDGSVDEDSVHIGRPVERGEKWLWRCALREHALF